MSITRSMLQAAAGSGGAGLDIPDVFSTYLYTGNGGTQTVTNGIDLAGEGGLVWLKPRDLSLSNRLMDSARGPTNYLVSNTTAQQQVGAPIAFSSSGFSVASGGASWNQSSNTYASWAWRKAPKFFDVQTWTGDGNANKEIAHNLGSTPGVIIIKNVSSAWNWLVYHRSSTNDQILNSTAAGTFSIITSVTSTSFNFASFSSLVNANGSTYVAYIFAHNDGDGEFGPDADQDIIKCGSYTHSSSTGNEIDLGFEPQWLLVKSSTSTMNWYIWDTMRGWSVTSQSNLKPNTSGAESTGSNTAAGYPQITNTGFRVGTNSYMGDNKTFIYMAIRRGPLNPPEAADEVFEPAITYDESNDPGYNSGFVTDMLWYRHPGNQYVSNDEMRVVTRLTQSKVLRMDQAIAETGNTSSFDFSNGADAPVNEDYKGWLWKRAPGFFDVVARDGTNNSSDTIKHNLGAAPELIITKKRNASNEWYVGHDFGATSFKRSYLEQTTAASSHSYGSFFHVGKPTDTEYFLDGANANYNASGNTYIDFLFATLDGISKVGSVSHSGSSTNVDCGFSAGARFVMLKRTDATGGWYIWDSVRGIIAGNDPYLLLNTTAAQVTNTDYIDPLSSGFQISGAFTDGDYLFYAIA